MFPRESGILLHPSSLPGPFGIGEIGPSAHAWIDVLAEMDQKLWQVLPLGPTGYGDSPYQSLSTFAGNEILISLEQLQHDGLLLESELADFPTQDPRRIDFGTLLPLRREKCALAAGAFTERASDEQRANFDAFSSAQASWLDDYALFRAIKLSEDLRPWTEWPAGLRDRDDAAMDEARERFAGEVQQFKVLQFLFDAQWQSIRLHAREKGVQLIGDLPIFVAHDSSDVWANRDLFFLDEHGLPTVVAGVPPDYFSETGQLWGNPLYDWNVHFDTNFAWWMERVRAAFSQVDILRIDHFRGFEKYWEIPGGDDTAMNGTWKKGPGLRFFDAVREQVPEARIIAEDLGLITREVEALREAAGLPGMRVLQFSFGNRHADPQYLLEGFPEHSVVYTGTHDNDTAVGWFHAPPETEEQRGGWQAERDWVREAAGSDGSEVHWDLIRLAHHSSCRTAIVPLQDVMGLGSEARMNTPGDPQGNWQWRFCWDDLRPDDRNRLRDSSHASGRA